MVSSEESSLGRASPNRVEQRESEEPSPLHLIKCPQSSSIVSRKGRYGKTQQNSESIQNAYPNQNWINPLSDKFQGFGLGKGHSGMILRPTGSNFQEKAEKAFGEV